MKQLPLIIFGKSWGMDCFHLVNYELGQVKISGCGVGVQFCLLARKLLLPKAAMELGRGDKNELS